MAQCPGICPMKPMRRIGRLRIWRDLLKGEIPRAHRSGLFPIGIHIHRLCHCKSIWIFIGIWRSIRRFMGDWVQAGSLPYSLQSMTARGDKHSAVQIEMARRAFYALCTHIDHSLRVLIGTLREEGLLDNTIICFTSITAICWAITICWRSGFSMRVGQYSDDFARYSWR